MKLTKENFMLFNDNWALVTALHIKSASMESMSTRQSVFRETPYFAQIPSVSCCTRARSSGTDVAENAAFFFTESSISSFRTMVSSQRSL